MTERMLLRDALAKIREGGSWIAGPGFMLATAHKPVGEMPG
jgi:hypothetical protein